MTSDHWASYYRSGALVSCPTNPEPYYTMEVRDAWVRFFAALADGDRVLDIGTGNGPVALIARQTAEENTRSYRIDGVDLADIDPHGNVPDGHRLLSGISFRGGVDTEALPFDDRQFDAISGQYIIEYTDTCKTLQECARVLNPGGRCQFILHNADSVIVRNALESLRQAELINETKVVARFRKYCEHAGTAPERAGPAQRSLFKVGAQLQDVAKTSSNPLLLRFVIDTISSLLATRSQLTAGQLTQLTAEFERDLRGWVRRLQELSAAALSQKEMAAVVHMAERAGLANIEVDTQIQGDDHLIGWRMTMSQAAI